jgi:hypothetical protein
MTELENKAAQKIAEFEAQTDTRAALDAAQLLSQVDPAAGSEARQRTRNEHVMLWGRLLCSIDAKIDPKFDPNWVPPMRITVDPKDYPIPKDPKETYVASIDTLPDPEMRKRYAEKEAKLAADTVFANAQRRIYRTGQQVTEQAKDYFTTVFVRSANSVATIEACAKAGQWNAGRTEQLRSWVRPPE